MGASHLSLRDRFYRHVEKTEDCWIWTGFADKPRRPSSPAPGYGMFHPHGTKTVRAHRVAWEIEVGPIPEGMSVLHRCDNPRCVRPDHLFLGTQADNMRDMRAKGRFVPAVGPRKTYHGERTPMAKVSEGDVREIRRLRAEGRTLQSIGDQFGLANNSVYYIVTRKTWKHVV